jgi:hypothetical protein
MSESKDSIPEQEAGQYEHSGVWDCKGCGASLQVKTKMDPLLESLACPDHVRPVEGDDE